MERSPPATGVTAGVSRVALVTGCSSGIGRATARHLAARGWTVYATARRVETIADLVEPRCRTLQLDVCDEPSMQRAVGSIEAEHGAVGVLVNNAGYGLVGPIEELDLDDVRRQFETNLFGPTRLTQLVLPAMRRQGWGKIVNVSSVGGRITVPGGGAYHASKHAFEALSDALRFEVRGFGIDVMVVEPGAIATRWVETAVGGIEQRGNAASPYAAFSASVAALLRRGDQGLLALAAGRPEAVARVIERAITARRPRTRYTVPAVAKLFTAAHGALPDVAWDAFMRRLLPSPGPDHLARRPARRAELG